MLVEGQTTHTASPITRHGAGLLTPQEFASQYPFVVRYANNTDHQEDSLVFTPHSGEHDTFGVFFYALTHPSQVEDEGRTARYLFRAEDVLMASSIPDDIRGRGVMIIPGESYRKEAERIRQMLYPEKDMATLKIGEHYTIGQAIYEKNLALRVSPESVGRLPILTIPTVLTINAACQIS